MRALKGVVPIAVSVGLILAVTAVLWRVSSTAAGSYNLVYIYLFPLAVTAIKFIQVLVQPHDRRNGSGSFAKLTAIRRPSSRVKSLAADRLKS